MTDFCARFGTPVMTFVIMEYSLQLNWCQEKLHHAAIQALMPSDS